LRVLKERVIGGSGVWVLGKEGGAEAFRTPAS
jgi:hypothetical protein